MTTKETFARPTLAFGLLCSLILLLVHPAAAAPNPLLPPILREGFTAWVKSGANLALDAWQKGGLMEGDNKVSAQAAYFRQIDRALGSYRSHETLEAKEVGQNSQIVYLSINFERGAVYARFHLYRTEKSWAVQNMDFSTKPEAIMPWLAFEGVKYSE
jgi:hypothetical protein